MDNACTNKLFNHCYGGQFERGWIFLIRVAFWCFSETFSAAVFFPLLEATHPHEQHNAGSWLESGQTSHISTAQENCFCYPSVLLSSNGQLYLCFRWPGTSHFWLWNKQQWQQRYCTEWWWDRLLQRTGTDRIGLQDVYSGDNHTASLVAPWGSFFFPLWKHVILIYVRKTVLSGNQILPK